MKYIKNEIDFFHFIHNQICYKIIFFSFYLFFSELVELIYPYMSNGKNILRLMQKKNHSKSFHSKNQ